MLRPNSGEYYEEYRSGSAIANILFSARNVTGKGMFDDTHAIRETVDVNNQQLAKQIGLMKNEMMADEYIARRWKAKNKAAQQLKLDLQLGVLRDKNNSSMSLAMSNVLSSRLKSRSNRYQSSNNSQITSPKVLSPINPKKRFIAKRNTVQSLQPSSDMLEMPKVIGSANFMSPVGFSQRKELNATQQLLQKQHSRTRSKSPQQKEQGTNSRRKQEKKNILQRKQKMSMLINAGQGQNQSTAMGENSQQKDPHSQLVTPMLQDQDEENQAILPLRIDAQNFANPQLNEIQQLIEKLASSNQTDELISTEEKAISAAKKITQEMAMTADSYRFQQQVQPVTVPPKTPDLENDNISDVLNKTTSSPMLSPMTSQANFKRKERRDKRRKSIMKNSRMQSDGSSSPNQSKKSIKLKLGKMLIKAQHPSGTSVNPHLEVYNRHKELLNLDVTTEVETHMNYYDMDVDSYHLKKKNVNHQLLLDGEAKEQFASLRPKEMVIPDEIKREIERNFVDIQDKSDPFVLALASIRQKKIVNKELMETGENKKFEVMMSLVLGEQCPDNLLTGIMKKVNSKIFKKDYKEFIDGKEGEENQQDVRDPENVFAKFAAELKDKRTFFELQRKSINPCVKELNEENQMFQYFIKQKNRKIPALPVIFKIRNLKLKLCEYRLNTEQIESLAEVVSEFPHIMQHLFLHRNGIKDEDMAKLMKALRELDKFKTLIIKHNIVGRKAIEELIPMLHRSGGNSLNELRLVDCKTQPEAIDEMLKEMKESNGMLKKLGLVQARLQDYHMFSLIPFLEKAKFLQELDLSWNKIAPTQMLQLAECLALNRQLTSVNLSWNFLSHPVKDHNIDDVYVEEDKELRQLEKEFYLVSGDPLSRDLESLEREEITPENYKKKKDIYLAMLKLKEKNNPMKYFNAEMLEYLGIFLKRNKKLLHLNLDSTGLPEFMLFHLVANLTRSQSCLSLHVSGNPGITYTLKEMLWRRIRAQDPHYEVKKVDIERDWKRDMESVNMRDKLLKQNMDVRHAAARAQDDPGLTEAIAVTPHSETQLVFTRKLGHKSDIPLSAQWKLLRPTEKCWICDRHTYTLFFWSQRTGIKAYQEYTSDGHEEQNTVKKIKAVNQNSTVLKQMERPHIMCAQNNWTPTPMLSLKEYCLAVDNQRPDFLEELIDRKLIPASCDNEKKLDANMKQLIAAETKEFTSINYNTFDQVVRCLHSGIRWRNLVKIDMDIIEDQEELFYQRSKIKDFRACKAEKKKMQRDANSEDSQGNAIQRVYSDSITTEKEIPPVYVYAIFHKPGKALFAVADQNDMDFDVQDYYLHKFMVPQRMDIIPPFNKKMRTIVKTREFKFAKSAFKEWKKDNDQIFEDICTHDFEHWKVNKVVTDKDDYGDVEAVFRAYAPKIKNIWISMASQSKFPQVSQIDFAMVADKKWLIIDKNLNLSALDLASVGAMFNEYTGKFHKEVHLPGYFTRFEFLEVLVRIAKAKFMRDGQFDCVSDALEHLLTDYVIKNYPDEDWNTFRKERLWNLEVSDTYLANMDLIKKLMNFYHQPRKYTFTRDDAYQMILRDAEMDMVHTDIVYAWGMSKMTVPKEESKYGNYDDIKLVEFLEFIARMADKRVPGDDMPLVTKIEMFLDELFDIIKQERRPVSIEQEEESESDDDY